MRQGLWGKGGQAPRQGTPCADLGLDLNSRMVSRAHASWSASGLPILGSEVPCGVLCSADLLYSISTPLSGQICPASQRQGVTLPRSVPHDAAFRHPTDRASYGSAPKGSEWAATCEGSVAEVHWKRNTLSGAFPHRARTARAQRPMFPQGPRDHPQHPPTAGGAMSEGQKRRISTGIWYLEWETSFVLTLCLSFWD